MLRRLLSFLGLLGGATLGACRCGNDAEPEFSFKADFPVTPEQTRALCGRQDLGKVWSDVSFADPLLFRQAGETIEAIGYQTMTLADFGEAYTGKYSMRATLRIDDTGGPPGSATEPFVDIEDVRLIERLSPPPAPPGVKGLLPGQIVVRKIGEGELARLDDKYLIELPANKLVTIWLDPWVERYPFNVSVTKDGVSFHLSAHESERTFHTTTPGIFEIRIRPGGNSTKEPDSYDFDIHWGDTVDYSGRLSDHRVKLVDVRAAGGKTPSDSGR